MAVTPQRDGHCGLVSDFVAGKRSLTDASLDFFGFFFLDFFSDFSRFSLSFFRFIFPLKLLKIGEVAAIK